jgi:hypothetical protein
MEVLTFVYSVYEFAIILTGRTGHHCLDSGTLSENSFIVESADGQYLLVLCSEEFYCPGVELQLLLLLQVMQHRSCPMWHMAIIAEQKVHVQFFI